MDEQDLSSALSLSKSAMRVDAVQDLLRNAIIRSSISMFNGLPHYFPVRFMSQCHLTTSVALFMT